MLKGKITGENTYVSMHLGDETCEPNGQGCGGWERTEFKLREGYQASLVAQLVNLPATWEKWVQSLGWEDPLERGMATLPSILG